MVQGSMGLQLAFIQGLYLIWCVFAIGKCHNRKLECPKELLNTPCVCKKTLEEDGLEVICENADVDQIGILLEKIPKETVIKHMRLRGNQIVHLPGLKFQHLHIHHLSITRSNVQAIDAMAFFNLDQTLISLDLSGNLLHSVPHEALQRLKALKTLNLNNNLITRVTNNAFTGMKSLLNLYLDNNDIEDVETFAFNGADNLTKIHLNHNKIKQLPGRMFSKSTSLEEIHLAYNMLDTFQEGFFQGVTSSLNRLDLGHNLFREVPPAISSLQQLEILNMNHNCLEEVSREAFVGKVVAGGVTDESSGLSNTLSALDLSSNNLSRVPVEALSSLENLSHLNLQNNSITSIPPHAFRTLDNSLKYLYLHQNRLSNISTRAFHSLRQLEWLYLARNKLTTLHEEAFRPVKKSLKILDIHDNPLKCDCHMKWISQTQWPALLSHEKETKCREPRETFGAVVTQLSNYPQTCEPVQTEASKLQRPLKEANNGASVLVGLNSFSSVFYSCSMVVVLVSNFFRVFCPVYRL